MRTFIKRQTWAIFPLFSTIVLLAVGCATIINSPRQDIFVESKPTGAKVIVKGRGTTITPSVINLPRNRSYIIRIEKVGYKPIEVTIARNMDMCLVGTGCLLFPIYGPVIDIKTGSAYKLNPSEVNVELEKE